MPIPSWITYPHVTVAPEVCAGQPCIAETGVRVVDVASAYEHGHSPDELLDYFLNRAAPGGKQSRLLTRSEIFAALAYYHDNRAALEEFRAEEERLAQKATSERHAAILKHYLGE